MSGAQPVKCESLASAPVSTSQCQPALPTVGLEPVANWFQANRIANAGAAKAHAARQRFAIRMPLADKKIAATSNGRAGSKVDRVKQAHATKLPAMINHPKRRRSKLITARQSPAHSRNTPNVSERRR